MAEASSSQTPKLRFVLSCGLIAVGLAVAGSIEPSAGGVLVLAGWLLGILTLHRLGREGPDSAISG